GEQHRLSDAIVLVVGDASARARAALSLARRIEDEDRTTALHQRLTGTLIRVRRLAGGEVADLEEHAWPGAISFGEVEQSGDVEPGVGSVTELLHAVIRALEDTAAANRERCAIRHSADDPPQRVARPCLPALHRLHGGELVERSAPRRRGARRERAQVVRQA